MRLASGLLDLCPLILIDEALLTGCHDVLAFLWLCSECAGKLNDLVPIGQVVDHLAPDSENLLPFTGQCLLKHLHDKLQGEVWVFEHALLPIEEAEVAACERDFEELIRCKWLGLHHDVNLVQMLSWPIYVVLDPLHYFHVQFQPVIEGTRCPIGNLGGLLVRVVELLVFVVLLVCTLELLADIEIVSDVPSPRLARSHFLLLFLLLSPVICTFRLVRIS